VQRRFDFSVIGAHVGHRKHLDLNETTFLEECRHVASNPAIADRDSAEIQKRARQKSLGNVDDGRFVIGIDDHDGPA
jgi:hypothetical protein